MKLAKAGKSLGLALVLALAVTHAHERHAQASNARTYPAPEGLAADPDYQVTVDGQPVFVWKGDVAAIASFDLTGKVDVAITPRRDVKWVDVRPLSARVDARIQDNIIRFTLDKPAELSVELNGLPLKHPLFLFANPPEEQAPDAHAPGVRVFEAGKVHKAGVVHIESGDTIYVAGGAVVEGLFMGENVHDVTIRGHGIIDGAHVRDWQPMGPPPGAPKIGAATPKVATPTPKPALPTTPGAPKPPGTPQQRRRFFRSVDLRTCAHVTIEGITLANGQTWELVPTNCQDVKISNIKIVSDHGGDDGIDIVRSRDITIDRAFVHTKDDCIAIKSFAWGQDPAEVGTENITVTRSVFWNAAWGNALEIGFELKDKLLRNLVFRDNDIIHVEDGAAFSIHNGDAATVSDVRFENIRVENVTQKLIDLAIFYTQYSTDRPPSAEERTARYQQGAWDGVLTLNDAERAAHASFRGHVRNVVFKDIRIVDGGLPFSIVHGYDAYHRVDDVVIENLTYMGKPLVNAAAAKLVTQDASVRFGGAPRAGRAPGASARLSPSKAGARSAP